MKRDEVQRQLCKMLGEVAGRMGTESTCVCDQGGWKNAIDEVPDEVISEMWSKCRCICEKRDDPEVERLKERVKELEKELDDHRRHSLAGRIG